MGKRTNNNRYIKSKQNKIREQRIAKRANKHIKFSVTVYVLIFCYLVFLLISFTNKNKVNYTIAESGQISESDVFTGLIVRNETLVKSKTEGEINYFVSEGTRVRKNTYICAVDSEGEMTRAIQSTMDNINSDINNSVNFDSTSYKYLQKQVRNYVINSNKNKFEYSLSTKNNIEKAINEISNTIIFSNDELEPILLNLEMYEDQLNSKLQISSAPISGLVSYTIDGLESVNINNLDLSIIGDKIESKDVVTNKTVDIDTPIYKIVDNYLWYIATEINEECATYLEGKTYITLYFTDKDISIDVKVHEITTNNNKIFAIFEIDRLANEFLTERVVKFKIEYSNSSGIKIPNSAVTKKEFLAVPSESIVKNGRDYGVKKKVYSADFVGGHSIEFIAVDMYYIDGAIAYIPIQDKTNIGDLIIYNNNNEPTEFPLSEKKDLEGVYVINKGFASFKLIETKYEENVYRIIKDDTPYGVRIYDKIATNATKVKDKQIIN